MRIFCPQWQGSGDSNDLYFSAMEIYEMYLKDRGFISIDVSSQEKLGTNKNILGLDSIVENLGRIVDLLTREKPKRIFCVGGDCGVELGPVSYLNRIYHSDMSVVWFDAHGDLNTPLSSPSKHFHGMPLRCLLGDGDESILKRCFSCIRPSQVILAGVRELDPPEMEYISNHNISTVSVDQLIHYKHSIVELIGSKNLRNIFVHVDLDVLDPDSFPYSKCPSKGGINKQQLLEHLHKIDDIFNIVGFSVVEYLSSDNDGKYEVGSLIDFGFGMKSCL